MPVESILRAYIDETVDEEVIEETLEKNVEEAVAKQMEETSSQELLDKANKKEETEISVSKTDKPELVKNSESNKETSVQQQSLLLQLNLHLAVKKKLRNIILSLLLQPKKTILFKNLLQ